MLRRALLLLPLLFACSDNVDDLATRDAGPRPQDSGPSGREDAGPRDAGTDGGSSDAGATDAGDRDGGAPLCETDPDCDSCAVDGQCCFFSINCVPGSICNVPGDVFYDPTRPDDVCIRVVCTNDDDCEGDRICSLEGVCADPVCQRDEDCPSAEVCRGGACVPPQNASVTSCRVLQTNAVVRTGGSAALHAIAYDSADVPVPGVTFAYASNEPSMVSIVGADAIGESVTGTATVTAQFGNVACAGAVQVTNHGPLSGQEIRIVAIDARTQAPIAGAEVTLVAGGPMVQTTDSRGAAIFLQGIIAPSSVTVAAPGHAVVTMMAPSVTDVVIPLPPVAYTMAAGFRGNVDLSAARPGDIAIGIVSPSLSDDVLAFGRTRLSGEVLPIPIRAPQLGLDGVYDMPTGFGMAVGSQQLTAPPERCFGAPVGADELGCFLARGRFGFGAGWTLSGRLRLSQITSIANELAGVLEGDPVPPELIVDFARIARQLNHGVEPALRFEPTPNVNTANGSGDCSNPNLPSYADNCRPDYASFTPADIAASQSQRVHTVVSVPNLPTTFGNACMDAVTVVAATRLGGRGIVPLGLGAGMDRRSEQDVPDCVVAGIDEPFGPSSAATAEGTVALSSAPRHTGLEDGELLLLAVARDAAFDRLGHSGIVRRVASLATTAAVPGAFLTPPRATVDTTAASVAYATSQGDFTRTELFGAGSAWLVYAPDGMRSYTLPDVAAGRAILADLRGAIAGSVQTTHHYGALFELGARTRIHQSVDYADAFVTDECELGATSGCTLR